MSFGTPGALWLLLLALPVLALHLYRGRVRRLAVPALALWDEVLAEEERVSAFSRLRHAASLVLVLLALVLLALTLAEPSWESVDLAARRFVLVVDASPELDAIEEDGRPRREAAIGAARDFLSRLGRRDRAALLDGTGVLEPSTGDRARLEAALDRVSGGRLPPEELRRLARAADPVAQIWVVGSRPWPDGIWMIPVGTPRANAGLLAGEARREGGRVKVELTAVHAGGPALNRKLELRSRGRVVSVQDLALAPAERRTLRLEAELGAGEALLEARLLPPDAVPDDDAAAWVLPSAEPFAVLLVAESAPDPHLVSALRVLSESGEFRLGIAKPGRWKEAWNPDTVVVLDRPAGPPPAEDGGWLILGGPGNTVPGPKVVDWERGAAANRWVDWGDLALKSSRILVTGTPLVRSDRGPIVIAERRPGRARIETGFGVGTADGDLALRPAFPIFLRNALRWLADEGRRGAPRAAGVGEVLRLEGTGTLAATEVEGEGGESREFAAGDSGWRIPLRRPGLLKLESGGRTEWVAVRGGPPRDVSVLPPSGGELPARPAPWRELPWAPLAGALAAGLLLAEWALHRRGLI